MEGGAPAPKVKGSTLHHPETVLSQTKPNSNPIIAVCRHPQNRRTDDNLVKKFNTPSFPAKMQNPIKATKTRRKWRKGEFGVQKLQLPIRHWPSVGRRAPRQRSATSSQPRQTDLPQGPHTSRVAIPRSSNLYMQHLCLVFIKKKIQPKAKRINLCGLVW